MKALKEIFDGFKKEASVGLNLINAGFEPDRFGQYKLNKQDGTEIILYNSWFGWTVDITTPDGKHLTEDDINVTEILKSYQRINGSDNINTNESTTQ